MSALPIAPDSIIQCGTGGPYLSNMGPHTVTVARSKDRAIPFLQVDAERLRKSLATLYPALDWCVVPVEG
jgi:hypothetical protein